MSDWIWAAYVAALVVLGLLGPWLIMSRTGVRRAAAVVALVSLAGAATCAVWMVQSTQHRPATVVSTTTDRELAV
jgi:predicted membrane-bound spermidine synthase